MTKHSVKEARERGREALAGKRPSSDMTVYTAIAVLLADNARLRIKATQLIDATDAMAWEVNSSMADKATGEMRAALSDTIDLPEPDKP